MDALEEAVGQFELYQSTGDRKAFNASMRAVSSAECQDPGHVDVQLLKGMLYTALHGQQGKEVFAERARTYLDAAAALRHQRPEESRAIQRKVWRLEGTLDGRDVAPVRFVSREKARTLRESYGDAYFYDVSTNAPTASVHGITAAPEFSPFMPYGGIPIPGGNGTSDSVEGVWQGLKVIRGKTDPSYFRGAGRRRPGIPEGHRYGTTVLPYVEARKKIFVPAYHHMLQEHCPAEIDSMVERALQGIPQFVFDVDENGNIGDTRGPLAHASVLAAYVNAHLGDE